MRYMGRVFGTGFVFVLELFYTYSIYIGEETITLSQVVMSLFFLVIAWQFGKSYDNKTLQIKELQAAKSELDFILDNKNVAIWSWNEKENKTMSVSAGIEELYGYTRKEFSEDPSLWKKVLYPEDQHVIDSIRRNLLSGKTSYGEFRIVRKDGQIRWIQDFGTPLFNEEGKLWKTSGVAIDITEHRNAQEALEQRESQLHTLINAMPDFVCFKDGKGRWVTANPFGLSVFGLEGVDYEGKTDTELSEYVSFYKETLLYCQISDEETWRYGAITRCEETVPQPNGQTKVFDVIKVPLYYDNHERKGLLVLGRDITDRKKAEAHLEESKQRYKSLFEQHPDLVCAIDTKGRITQVNKAIEKVTGYTQEYFQKITPKALFPHHYAKKVMHYFNKAVMGQPSHYEIQMNHKEGHVIDLEVEHIPIVVNNSVEGVYAVVKDITAQKKNEEVIRRSEKLSVVGELAAGVAHEIRNPLTSIKGFIQMMQANQVGNDRYFQIMLSELDRINFIVSELLILSKPQVLSFKEKRITPIIEEVITLLDTQAIMNNIKITAKMDSGLPPVRCEENQIKQVFINVLKNAIEAMPSGGEISVHIKETSSNRILIRVIDQGEGIPENIIKKLGEPFYTTKENGTGLGLMVSYKIIEDHQGTIHITSKVNEGTTIDVHLPTAALTSSEN
ncbi:PAS domain S-box protein [Bacillus taeanensis]|uniref:histidine kinase n=1 Tax=Bacillus taeanensis TaxID=273032 RepID=A0A366Y1U5_9BACI|nr:PAS domain S-box protein [Bacillus taeanensis]RBW71355.1 PAS domain-containing sensor histidine kinase [Bacillus taeanensis]